MKGLYAALWAESRKVRKSRIFWLTTVLFAFVAFMMGILMFFAKHPDLISSSAIMSAKAAIFSQSSWPAYFSLLYQVIAMIGLIGFGFVFSWTFGREYADFTVKDILALPVPRYMIVMAKYITAFIWSALLAMVLFGVGLASGAAVHLTGWPGRTFLHICGIYSMTSLLTIFLCTPVAFFACYGRGYLLPIGFVILIMIMTQFIAIGVPAIAPYFPWSVPALYCGAAGPLGPHPGAAGFIVLAVTCLAGIFATIAWWRYADQK
jgi:ABC-2 type transport system permease protein